MDIKHLQKALHRAGGILSAARAKPHAQAVRAIESLLEIVPDSSVSDFVERTTAALNAPKVSELSAPEVSARLRDVGVDRTMFNDIFNAVSDRSFAKEKTIEVAALFTGSRTTAWSTKPQALKAIKAKFDEYVFLDSKSRHNAKVTPW